MMPDVDLVDDAAWYRNRLRWMNANVVLSILVFVALVLAAPALINMLGARPATVVIAVVSGATTSICIWVWFARRRYSDQLSSAELHEELAQYRR